MIRKLLYTFLAFAITASGFKAQCQSVDSTSIKIYSRLSFYSFEKNGEFLLHIPHVLSQNNIVVSIKSGEEILATWTGKALGEITRVPFSLNLPAGNHWVIAMVTSASHRGIIYKAATSLTVLKSKTNEVKADRLTGGLIVNRRQFFPFGFYCYSPVYPTLPEEEVVKGFNLISPYQKIVSETISDRKAYMDRCAELGMKVNYNLLSVSGGGGVGSKTDGLSDDEKRKRLLIEIAAFRDHPALLGWYIADEPTGNNVSPETLEEIYRVVKENDPWHPVSIVFMAPFISSSKYINAMDIAMADPYPLPDHPASMVGDIAGQLRDEFRGKRPVWIVPQAFGGGELWSREPTLQELRSMTWQSIINGATGIQYFVRQGLNYFPKSAATWGECGRMAMEAAELTPWLLSDEETMNVISYSKNVQVTSRLHNGQLIIMAVNRINEPVSATFRIQGIYNTKAKLIFENRVVPVNGGTLTDQLSAFGSQVYLIDLKPEKQAINIEDGNLIKDSGFEDNSSPGIPSACYARPGGDRGATYFLDSREHLEGSHSLRLVTPEKDKSVSLRFFPCKIKAGATYTISLWAKSDPEQRFNMLPEMKDARLNQKTDNPQYVEVLFGEFGHARFTPDNEWKQYLTFVTIPADTTSLFKTNLILKMPGQGVAWFDQVRVVECK